MATVADKLKAGGVGVILTDTLFGIVGQAFDRKAVERIYRVKSRNPKKPFIILISSIEDLRLFGIKPSGTLEKKLLELWPGKVSIIIDLPKKIQKKFAYLHRGTKTLAFRLPAKKALRDLISETGPLVAPSANPADLPPAKNTSEAKKYFGNSVDFYSGKGRPSTKPSTLIRIEGNKFKILRP